MATLAWPELCRRLSELRAQHDPPLTQQQAADLIGVSLRQYGRLERGQANATLATIRKIASAYGVDPRLLTGAGTEPDAVPTSADLARVERKLELLLAHFGLAADAVAQAPDLAAALGNGLDRVAAAPPRRRRVTAGRARGPTPA